MELNFLVHLETELSRRKLFNSNYSLRAFARDLNIEASMLSKILRRKVPLTSKMLERLAPFLAVSPENMIIYLEQIKKLEQSISLVDIPIKKLRNEELNLIREWYHFTIVELTSVSDFDSSPKWIGQKLGITTEEAELALERLIKLGFLIRQSNGNIIATHTVGSGLRIISEDHTSYLQALRDRWEQIVDKSIAAIDEVPPEKRIQRNLAVCIDSNLVEEARIQIRDFTRDLVDKLQKKSKNKDHVFELAVSFFPLTKD